MGHRRDAVLAFYGGCDTDCAGTAAFEVIFCAPVAADILFECLPVAGDVDVGRIKLQQFVYAPEYRFYALPLKWRENLKRKPCLSGGGSLCNYLGNFHCMFLGMSVFMVSSGMLQRRE